MRNQTGVKAPETKQRILEAALQLFREKGFEPATMRDIAAAAGVATGAAYYYFPSKFAIVLEFYRQSTAEFTPELETALSATRDLQKRLAIILDVKLRYFAPSRGLLSALAAHADPADPVSPFSQETREIRERDIELFRLALADSKTKVPDDLEDSLPRLLWLYQMGLILYWVHDRSDGQKNTGLLIEKSLWIVVRLIRFSNLPLMSSLRRRVIELYDVASR
jgi:AcrR family transcriptional regulator